MDLIGLTGRKYHGKDTAAAVLVKKGYAQLRFADPLKEMLRAFYRTVGLPFIEIERRIEGDLKETPCPHLRGKTPRYAMQTLGAEWGRDMIGTDLWVSVLTGRAAKAGKAVVSDVRYDNECAAITAAGGRVFRVDANKRVDANEFSHHSSEMCVDALPVAGVIDNNDSENELKRRVESLVGL